MNKMYFIKFKKLSSCNIKFNSQLSRAKIKTFFRLEFSSTFFYGYRWLLLVIN